AALECEIDDVAAGIALHELESSSERVVEDERISAHSPTRADRAHGDLARGRLGDRLYAGAGRDHDEIVGMGEAADPVELGGLVIGVGDTGDLVERHALVE